MLVQKQCNLCGCSSQDTAIFTADYAKGTLNICLGCLAEGINEISRELKAPKKELQPLAIDDLELSQNEVFGFSCEKCGNILFTDNFPATCDCGHLNNELVLKQKK